MIEDIKSNYKSKTRDKDNQSIAADTFNDRIKKNKNIIIELHETFILINYILSTKDLLKV